MNPNRGESQINFELPPQPTSPEGEDQKQEQAVEAPPVHQEQVGKRAPQPVLPAIPDIPAADQPVIGAPPQDVTTPLNADLQAHTHDPDRIEHEWVDKAKAIIASTQDDPYIQKREMSKVKAEYIQKRFNKQIKTDEAPA